MQTYSSYLLLEDRVDFLWNQYRNWYLKKHNIDDFAYDNVLKQAFGIWTGSDPTPNKQYLQWIVQKLNSGGISGIEDHLRVKNALTLFHNNKQRLPVDKRDINKIRSLHDLEDLVEPFEGKVSNRQQEKLIKHEGAEVYYEDNDWLMLKITTPEAACYYGKNTKWCTSGIDTAREYIESEGFLLIFIDKKNNRKYQATPSFKQFMDEKDRRVGSTEIGSLLSLQKVLKKSGYEEKVKEYPVSAAFYAKNVLRKRWHEAEPYIMKSARAIFWYCYDVLNKARWPEAEEYIKKEPEWAYYYATDILKTRWPEAEEYIKKSPRFAYYYAMKVIEGRFPEAEKYIKKDKYFWSRYSEVVLDPDSFLYAGQEDK